MAQQSTYSTVRHAPNGGVRVAKYILAGAAAGLVIGVATLFVVALLQGGILGLPTAARLSVAGVLTLLLSQPAGAAGMIAGATVGGIAGAVVSFVRRPS